jgi:hypothetical protein
VIIHVVGLGLFNVKMVQVLTAVKDRRHFTSAFALVIGFTAIWATFLHAIEAGIWAAAYLLLKAVPDAHMCLGQVETTLRFEPKGIKARDADISDRTPTLSKSNTSRM